MPMGLYMKFHVAYINHIFVICHIDGLLTFMSKLILGSVLGEFIGVYESL